MRSQRQRLTRFRDWPYYAGGRLSAIATRPLCLFVANNYLEPQTAQGLAIAFLASALALVGTAADPHRRFYLQYFATDHALSSFSYHVYLASLVLLSVLGCAIVFAIVLGFGDSFMLVGGVIVYFLSERIADELLRLRLFERDFGAWGRANIARSLLQLSGLAILLGVLGQAAPAWLSVLVLSIGNFMVFVPQLPNRFWLNLWPRRFGTAAWLVRRSARSLLDNRILWGLALITASVGYIDRLIALVLDTETLPLFMMVVMCFSIVQMAVDSIYVSRHRRDFLERRISIGNAFASGVFVGSFGAGFVIAVAACVAVLHFSHNGDEFPLGYVFAIASLQLALAIVIVPQQILYWSHGLTRMFRIELTFWILFTCAVLMAWWLRLPVVGFLGLSVACALMRLVLYIAAAAHSPPRRGDDNRGPESSL